MKNKTVNNLLGASQSRLVSGPPGCVKSMLADAFHTILPDVCNDVMLEVYSIYHLAKEKRGFSMRPP